MKWSSSSSGSISGRSSGSGCSLLLHNVPRRHQQCRLRSVAGVVGKASALITPSSIKRLSSCAQSPYATSPLSLPLFASGTTDVRNAAQLPIKLTHKINTHIYIYTYIVYMFIFHVHYSPAMKLLLKASNWQKKCGQREKNVQLIEENLAYPCRRY